MQRNSRKSQPHETKSRILTHSGASRSWWQGDDHSSHPICPFPALPSLSFLTARYGVCGSAVCSPCGPRRSPVAKRFFVHFGCIVCRYFSRTKTAVCRWVMHPLIPRPLDPPLLPHTISTCCITRRATLQRRRRLPAVATPHVHHTLSFVTRSHSAIELAEMPLTRSQHSHRL